MPIDLNQGVNEQFDAQRKKAVQQEGANYQRQRDALARRHAAQPGAPGGAFIKQEQLAGDESANRLQSVNEGIDAAQNAENRRIREIQQGQEFQRGERLGSQEFAHGERLGSQDFTAGESALQRKYLTDERLGSQSFAHDEAVQARLGQYHMQEEQIKAAAREGQLTREQANAALRQAQNQFEQSLAEERRVNDFNMNQKDPLEKAMENLPGLGGLPQLKGYAGRAGTFFGGGGGGGTVKSPTSNAITRRLGF